MVAQTSADERPPRKMGGGEDADARQVTVQPVASVATPESAEIGMRISGPTDAALARRHPVAHGRTAAAEPVERSLRESGPQENLCETDSHERISPAVAGEM